MKSNRQDRIARRQILKLAAAGATAAAAGSILRARPAAAAVPRRLPVLFVPHDPPAVALAKDDFTKALRRFAAGVGRPRAVVIASPHFPKGSPLEFMTGDVMPPLLHDIEGFPPALAPTPALMTMHYPCRGSSNVSLELENELWGLRIQAVRNGTRGLDHGAWIPLLHLFPKADVPVIEMSIPPGLGAGEYARLGAAFFLSRSRGILFVGSGSTVRNLARLKPDGAPSEPWAKAFDDWIAGRLDRRADDDLIAWKQKAPEPDLAQPSDEHLAPLFLVLGATDRKEKVKTIHQGFRHGTLSMRTFTIG